MDFTLLGYAIAIVRKLKTNHKFMEAYSDENEQKSSRDFIGSNEHDDFYRLWQQWNREEG